MSKNVKFLYKFYTNRFEVVTMMKTKKRVSIGLTDEQYELVNDLAKSRGFSKSAIFVLALEEYAQKQIEK